MDPDPPQMQHDRHIPRTVNGNNGENRLCLLVYRVPLAIAQPR
ncbi:hypothetical protein [Trichothermofontia sp.]